MYPYFDVVVGLPWSDDPESRGGGSVAGGRASNSVLVKGHDPKKKVYPGPSGWALRFRLTTSPHKLYLLTSFSVIRNRTETTKTTQHGQGFMSWNMERAISVQTWQSAEPDSSNTRI
jgi:hypothetical protein